MFRKDTASQTAAKARCQLFIKTASAYLNYSAEISQRNMFGERVGYNSQPWAGAFIDVVARQAGLDIPACVYTGSALGKFINAKLTVDEPQPGDIVFFNFASEHAGSQFAMPHAGIVTDVRKFDTNGEFVTIEGNTTNGTNNNSDRDGVYQRLRYTNDVLLFVRPAELSSRGPRPGQLLTKLLKLSRIDRIDSLEIQEAASEYIALTAEIVRPGRKNRAIEVVQLALGMTVGLEGANRGTWDRATSAAFADFQRLIGFVGPDANGNPDRSSLQRLAKMTNLFQVSDD